MVQTSNRLEMHLSHAVATKNGLKSHYGDCRYQSQKSSILQELRHTGCCNTYQLLIGEAKNPCKIWGISQHGLSSKTQSSHSFEISSSQQFTEKWWNSFQCLKEIAVVYWPACTRGAVIRKGNALVDTAAKPVSCQLVVKITAIALGKNLRSNLDHPRKL